MRDVGGAGEKHLTVFFRKLIDFYKGPVPIVLDMSQKYGLFCKMQC